MSNAAHTDVKEYPVVVELLRKGEFQKEGSLTAQLRQKIETIAWYPSKQSSNNMTDSLFSNKDFGYTEQPFESNENRVAFMLVPEGTTLEEIAAKLETALKARIYKVLSNQPILTTSQDYAIRQRIRTKEEFANSQVARYGEGTEKEGQLVLDVNGKPQYRATFFSAVGKSDEDRRTSDPKDFFETEEIHAELNNGEILVREVEIADLGNIAENDAQKV